MDEEEFQDATNEVATEDLSIAKYQTVQDGVLEEVRFPKEVVEEAQQAWSAYTMASTKEAAGEMLYAAIFNVAPSLQGLFKIPRPTMAARFMNSINAAVAVAHRPSALKGQAEALGFQHFDIEVTSTRGDIFREAILEVLDMELGARFTTRARMGLAAIMNYLIGANIFVRREYADRIHVLQQSWKMANEQALSAVEMAEQEDALYESAENLDEKRSGAASPKTTDVQVPTSFTEMFHFNAAVMGFNSDWMNSVLFSLNDLVAHAAASYRLNEECAVLSLVLAQQTQPAVLSEFKAVMLASLRSLVAKEWSSQHEIAWSWFWENVMRILKSENFKPQVRLQALENFLLKLSPAELSSLHRNVFKKFFELAPKGQDYFKQSIERLNYIVDQILAMSIDIYREPREMVRKISALGLRHVGYAIPTELFPPFVSGSIEVIRSMTTDEATESAFRWSLTLISKILVRSINEGSTVVMKAVNTNQEKALRLAVSMAPRGKRNMEMLNVAVGTESISPLYWAIETGSSQVAKAMIIDLLTIRADRDNYYYGNEALFTRHPDIIQKLCVDGPSLLWPLLDGLIWRSRMVSQGMRRVNYYIQHLVQDAEGNMNKALKWMAAAHDPKLIAHPIAEFFSDLMWERLVSYRVFVGKIYLVFGLLIFILGHALYTDYQQLTDAERVFVFVCRGFNYSATMLQLFIRIIFQIIADIRRGQIVRIYRVPFPKSLCSLREMGYLLLIAALSCCCALEPILWCFNNMEGDFPGSGLFTSTCPEGAAHHDAYSLVAGVAMVLYWLLAIDISIFSMRISAFFLVCFQVLVEFWLYLLGLSFLIIAFATSLSALNHEIPEVTGIDQAALTLLKVSLSIYPAEKFAELEASGWVFVVVCIFLLLASMFLLNLLVAQVSEAYAAIVTDMYGYARLSRAGVIVSIIEKTSSKRWNRFLMSLNFDKPLEFNEGDIGLAGGMSILEPASANPTPVDRIKRYGGTTSSEKPWPEEPERLTDEDKFLHLEKLILRMSKRKRRHHGGGSNASSQGTGDDANTNTISTQETQETQESAEVSE